MTWIIAFALTVITLIGIAAWVTVHARTESGYRAASVLLFLGSIPAMLVALSLILGVPYPVYGIWPFTLPVGSSKLVAFKAVPNTGIYLLIDNGDYSPPSYYKLPWDKDLAMNLNGTTEGEASIDVEGQGQMNLFSWDFSFKTLPPKVSSNDMPSRPFEPKQNPFEQPRTYVLPPAN